MNAPILPSGVIPSWRPSPFDSPIIRWVLVAIATTLVIASIAYDPTCTVFAPCETSWLFSIAAPLLLGSVVLLWWRPALALPCGAGYSAFAVFADPSAPGRYAALAYGLLCLFLIGGRRVLHHLREAELQATARIVAVPPWVEEAARRNSSPPLTSARLVAAAAGLAVALISVGLLIGSWSTYQDRLTRAEEVTASVVDASPEDPHLITLEHIDGVGRLRRSEILTVAEYPIGRELQVRVDPEDASWFELVNEPWDDTYWLSLALVGAASAAFPVVDARARRRATEALVRGEHLGVRVCAAPLEDGTLGLSHIDDPSREVWGVMSAPMGLRRAPSQGDWTVDLDGLLAGARWARPTIGVLWGDLREHGSCGLMLDSSALVTPDLRVARGQRLSLRDPSPELALPTDLEVRPAH